MLPALAGILLLAMILITLADGLFFPQWIIEPAIIAGACAWVAAMLRFRATGLALQLQVGLLIVAGLGLILIAHLNGGEAELSRMLSANTGMLSMVAAVGFLRLVALPVGESSQPLPRGKWAYLQTIAGLNLSSSIINISAPILIGDRIHQVKPLDRLSIQSFTRVFCSASSWSPFFAAMAVVVTFVDGVELSTLVVYGLPFTLTGVALTILEARLRFNKELQDFVGYPAKPASLTIPLLLIMLVGLATSISPDTAVLIIISSSALIITLGILLLRHGPSAAGKTLSYHVTHGLPTMQNELCLFLAAGVLATGISALIANGQLVNPLTSFNSHTAGLLLMAMLLLSVLGIHPIIQISSMTPLLMELDPDPNLLAATYLFVWHLGTCASPLSGTNLVFQGRYGVPAWRIALWNIPYGIVMAGIGSWWLSTANGLLQ